MRIGRIKSPFYRLHRPTGVKGLLVPMALGLVLLTSSAKAAGGVPKAPVSTITLKKQAIQYTQTVPGRVNAFKVAEVRPQVTGIVLERFFEEGGMVKKGQPLYQIDSSTYQAVYDSARADLLNAKAKLDATQARDKRYGRLVKTRRLAVRNTMMPMPHGSRPVPPSQWPRPRLPVPGST